MKNIFLIFILCLIAARPCFAQNNMEAMRFLTVNALMQYGQKLYDRGDFNEACAVFNHVLTFDGHQSQALQYLKDMGHSPAPVQNPIPSLISSPIQQPQRFKPFVYSTQNTIVFKKSDEQVVANIVDVMDIKSLKAAIASKKRDIEKLKAQIMQMQANKEGYRNE